MKPCRSCGLANPDVRSVCRQCGGPLGELEGEVLLPDPDEDDEAWAILEAEADARLGDDESAQ